MYSQEGPWDFFSSEYFIPEDNRYRNDFIYIWPPQYPKMLYVWRATHREDQTIVVFKSIHEDLADDPHREREENQKLIEHTKNHQNLVKVIEVQYDPPPHWICYKLEYCEGGTLHDHLYNQQRRKALSPERCLDITEGILRGLSHLHTCTDELVHRDLKPENIFFCKDGIPKIGDYGLVISMKWRSFVSTAGTIGYKAPEKRHDRRSDIYSIGIILDKMLKGPDDKEIINNEQVVKIINKAIAKEPNDRYQSTEEFLEAIKGIK